MINRHLTAQLLARLEPNPCYQSVDSWTQHFSRTALRQAHRTPAVEPVVVEQRLARALLALAW